MLSDAKAGDGPLGAAERSGALEKKSTIHAVMAVPICIAGVMRRVADETLSGNSGSKGERP